MIPDPTPNPHPTLDQWLTTSHTALINALGEVLDLDTGLADATLTTHYNTLTTDLDHVLDLDAGLQNIQSQDATTTNRAIGATPLTDYAHRVAARPARERLAARIWFPQHELAALQAISTAINGVRALILDFDGVLGLEGPRVLELEGSRILDRHLAVALERSHALDRVLDSVRVRVLIRNLIRGSTFDRSRALDRVLDRSRRLTRDLISALVDNLADVDDLAHDLARVLALAHVRAHDLARDLAHTHADIVARARARLLAVDNNDLASDLDTILARVDTLTRQDLNTALTQLEQALTDVTGADLIDADLSGVPLDGVLWSSNTCWPHHLREQITQNSQRIGPNLYRISSSGTGRGTFVDQNR